MSGAIGLFVDQGTEVYFTKLRISKIKQTEQSLYLISITVPFSILDAAPSSWYVQTQAKTALS